ncbi:hypothetical protein LDO26_15225 [Luteimonas sp. BDR2-5]|uniref:hypothetical protein n=1 Tax=Proluteimonas luteida TaxID=2878685 RepID=UPI001E5994FA|nr:hypothetical protein [Luteimonas sp. BDR2-5]MCD9029544.1 hypothetical protein [Luteimonas sp. BDR2-5]
MGTVIGRRVLRLADPQPLAGGHERPVPGHPAVAGIAVEVIRPEHPPESRQPGLRRKRRAMPPCWLFLHERRNCPALPADKRFEPRGTQQRMARLSAQLDPDPSRKGTR